MKSSLQSPVSSSQSATTAMAEDRELKTGNSPTVPLFSFRSGHQVCRVLDPMWVDAEFSRPSVKYIELFENARDWLMLSMRPNVQSRGVFAVIGPDGVAERFLSISFDSRRIRIPPAMPGRGDPELVCSICRWFSVETFEEPMFRCGDAKSVSHPVLILPEDGVREVVEGASLEKSGESGASVDLEEPFGYLFLEALLSKYGKNIESFLRTSGFGVSDLPGYSQMTRSLPVKLYSWILESMGVMTPEALTLELAELRERLAPQILIQDDREVRTSLDLDMPWILPMEEFKKWLDESRSAEKDL